MLVSLLQHMVQNQMAPGSFPQFAQTPGLEEFQQSSAGAMSAGAIPIAAQSPTTVADPQAQYSDPLGQIASAANGVEQQTVSQSVSSVSLLWLFLGNVSVSPFNLTLVVSSLSRMIT